ncbi:MAG: response regulator transcription factor [Deltaproteobacteria bacterium]|nr:response regulator transcription factor [Deltaproteobacteria bacterium]
MNEHAARARVLLVEDDEALGQQVVEQLRRAELDVAWLKDGDEARRASLEGLSLVILDLMLPGAYGLDVLRRIRERSDVPVLILSARNDTQDKVRGLALGADDYLGKPFWPEELLARVRARLRRPILSRTDALEVGPIRIDIASRVVTVAGREVELTKTELELLLTLARRAGSAISRQALVDAALDPDRQGTERTLDVHVSRLRKKLGEAGDRLETVWGVGYRLRSGP